MLITNRCDRCPAISRVRLVHQRDNTDLEFCMHHYNRFAVALLKAGFNVITTLSVAA